MTDVSEYLTEFTAKIVSAFAGNNAMSPAELPTLIETVQGALKKIVEPEAASVETAAIKTAAQIRKSITPDALISFVDGKPYRTLKRHLTTHGLTVADYKAKFGLPQDYPTTAPSYSAARSAMAKAVGLGKGRRKPAKPLTPPRRG